MAAYSKRRRQAAGYAKQPGINEPQDSPTLNYHPGFLGSWCLALILSSSVGCSSLTSRISRLTNPETSPTNPSATIAGQVPLANPSNQALQIALETARLAEQRAMDDEAIVAYEKVRSLNPNQPGVAHALAVLYDRNDRTDAAKREYAAAMAESPNDSNVLCDYGYFLYSTGNSELAEQTLRRALTSDPEHRQAIINLATVLADARKYEESASLFEQAIGPAAATHNIGMFKLKHGELDEGKRLISEASQQDPSIQSTSVVLQYVDGETTGTVLADTNSNRAP